MAFYIRTTIGYTPCIDFLIIPHEIYFGLETYLI
jgi:hypothetical protein